MDLTLSCAVLATSAIVGGNSIIFQAKYKYSRTTPQFRLDHARRKGFHLRRSVDRSSNNENGIYTYTSLTTKGYVLYNTA